METKEILEKVKTGELSVEEAEQFFKKSRIRLCETRYK